MQKKKKQKREVFQIYSITDTRSEKVIYIGLTRNFRARYYNHLAPSQGYFSKPIDLYIKQEGKENFKIEIIDCIFNTIYDARNLEQKYIEYFNTHEEGFNIHQSGNRSGGRTANKQKTLENYYKVVKTKAEQLRQQDGYYDNNKI